MTPKRDWTDARRKLEAEGFKCRVTGKKGQVELAHTIGRKHDRERKCEVCLGLAWPCHQCGGDGQRLWVNPLHVVPLDKKIHQQYDRREFDLLPHLTKEEQAAAVELVGLEAARSRITGRLNRIVTVAEIDMAAQFILDENNEQIIHAEWNCPKQVWEIETSYGDEEFGSFADLLFSGIDRAGGC